jgi:hypothetical protein
VYAAGLTFKISLAPLYKTEALKTFFLKYIFAYFLIIILSIPVLPVREVGKLLSSNQLTEELLHSADAETKDGKDFKFKEHLVTTSDYPSSHNSFIASEFFDHHSLLPAVHASDIPTPPPDCVLCQLI